MQREINGQTIDVFGNTLAINHITIPTGILNSKQKAAIMHGSTEEAEKALQDLYIHMSDFMANLQHVVHP